jgi:hypothetical protein
MEAVVVGGLRAMSPAPETKQSSISGLIFSRTNDSTSLERVSDPILKRQRKTLEPIS